MKLRKQSRVKATIAALATGLLLVFLGLIKANPQVKAEATRRGPHNPITNASSRRARAANADAGACAAGDRSPAAYADAGELEMATRTLRAMNCEVELVCWRPDAERRLERAARWLSGFEARFSRFDPTASLAG